MISVTTGIIWELHVVYGCGFPKGQIEGKYGAGIRVLLKGETKWLFKVLPD